MSHLDVATEADVWLHLRDVNARGRIGSKPRTHGRTMIIDRSLGLAATEDLLGMAGDYIDQVKLAFGTSVLVSPEWLRTKIALIRSYGIDVYPGGTLGELAITQGVFPEFLRTLKLHGFTAVEISDGTADIPLQVRGDAIRRALDEGLKVITEVGKKDKSVPVIISKLCEQAEWDIRAGAANVIVEAREQGMGIGVFDQHGELDEQMAGEILEATAAFSEKIMWEAPLPKQQAALIGLSGANVNLGNIQPLDVLGLEAQRRGLRFEIFSKLLNKK